MVVLEIRHQAKAARYAKAVTQARQGQRMKWESTKKKDQLEGPVGNGSKQDYFPA